MERSEVRARDARVRSKIALHAWLNRRNARPADKRGDGFYSGLLLGVAIGGNALYDGTMSQVMRVNRLMRRDG